MKKFTMLILLLAIGFIMGTLVGCDGDGDGDELFTVTVVAYDTTCGKVTIEPQKEEFASGEAVTVKVEANDGYVIKEVCLDNNDITASLCQNKGEYTFKINRDRTLKVEFERISHSCNLKFRASQGDVTMAPKKDRYLDGDEITITVDVKDENELDTFTVNGTDLTADLVAGNGTYKLIATDDMDIVVRFKQDFTIIKHPTTLEEFNKEIDCDGKVIVDFWAECCIPCVQFTPILEQLAKEGKVKVVKVEIFYGDWEENSAYYEIYEPLGKKYGSTGYPFLLSIEDGEVVDSYTGMIPILDELKEWLQVD